jgi:hypothetical protein
VSSGTIAPGRRLRLAMAFLAFLMATLPVYAQSCALCYTQAASSGSRMIQALRDGILILVIPPMFLSVGFTVLAYRKRNQFRRPDSSGLDDFEPKDRLPVQSRRLGSKGTRLVGDAS